VTTNCNVIIIMYTADADHVMITPSEVAILHCMMQGGTTLTLKAHFLDTLPDLYPITHTLLYFNMSFNDLRTFPNKIMQCNQLVCLKMRNNPIREIPNSKSLTNQPFVTTTQCRYFIATTFTHFLHIILFAVRSPNRVGDTQTVTHYTVTITHNLGCLH